MTMNIANLEQILREETADFTGRLGVWQMIYDGVPVACMADDRFDRMRLISPIGELESLTPFHLMRALEANFHSSLDGRYAISEGVMYAAFIHPLSPLSEAELRSALRQVVNLVKTFGSTYSSGVLEFGPGRSNPNEM